MNKKKKIIIIITFTIIVVITLLLIVNHKQEYTYEWVEEKNSSIGQYRLYINDSKGKHINGTARIVYINGKSQKIYISKEGLLYVKSVVLEVRNPNKR